MISVVIPAYNESARIGDTVRAVIGVLESGGTFEVLVVDDGSTDETSRAADSAGATVIRTETNRGKGAALNLGLAATRGDVVAVLDADLGNTADQAACLIEPVSKGIADMTVATFPVIPGKGGGFGFVIRLARWGVRRITGRAITAPLSGQRAFRWEVWAAAGEFSPGFGAEVGFTIDALCRGFTILEVPTTMTHRVTGRDAAAIRHRSIQFAAVARTLWKRRGLRCR